MKVFLYPNSRVSPKTLNENLRFAKSFAPTFSGIILLKLLRKGEKLHFLRRGAKIINTIKTLV